MNHISDQEMRALTNQASGGPWEAREDDLTEIWKVEYDQEHRYLIAEIGGAEWNSENDAEFIAACREWVPGAVRRLKAVRELANNLQSWIDEGRGDQSISRQAMRDAILEALDGDQ